MLLLLTGGAGFIGSHLAQALSQGDDDIVLLDDLSTGSASNVESLLTSGRAGATEQTS